MADASPPSSSSSSATTSGTHLSIGEVLALLLEEFPDVTISKIRFLESQGLIDPERTASGYRKFYDGDVDLLRCILREQRENYLPLRVIKDRIAAGDIDPTHDTPRPRGIKNVSGEASGPAPDRHPSAGNSQRRPGNSATGAATLFANTDGDADQEQVSHDATDPEPERTTNQPSTHPPGSRSTEGLDTVNSPDSPTESLLAPGLLIGADELCKLAGLTRAQLTDLESYGVLASDSTGGENYGEDALQIAMIARRFLDAGIDSRHLRGWRVAADREAGLLEQLIQPLLRQRNPEARARAIAQLEELETDGGKLRAAMVRSSLRHHTAS